MTSKSISPDNIARQNVSVMLAVFNDKTAAALLQDGFIATLTKIWNMLNVKSVTTHHHLNDPNRKAFESLEDTRLPFLVKVADAVKTMQGGKGRSRSCSLTTETRDALYKTLHGIVFMIRKLLSEDHQFVLTAIFQSDRLENEFGI